MKDEASTKAPALFLLSQLYSTLSENPKVAFFYKFNSTVASLHKGCHLNSCEDLFFALTWIDSSIHSFSGVQSGWVSYFLRLIFSSQRIVSCSQLCTNMFPWRYSCGRPRSSRWIATYMREHLLLVFTIFGHITRDDSWASL